MVSVYGGLPITCGNIVRSVFSVSKFLIHIGPLPRNKFVIYKRAAMQYIACWHLSSTLLALYSLSKSANDKTTTLPPPRNKFSFFKFRLPIRMQAFIQTRYWIYVSANQCIDDSRYIKHETSTLMATAALTTPYKCRPF